MAEIKNFISIADIEEKKLFEIIKFAKNLKANPYQPLLKNKHLAMIFEKNSTRTRVSFEVGIKQLMGQAVILSSSDMQLGRGESIEDTAKVLSRYVDLAMIRANSHDDLVKFSENATIPVINGLTNFNHPCQVMADLLTIDEHKGKIEDLKITWIGDGNNMCHSWINAALKFKFELSLALSEKYMPNKKLLEDAKKEGAKINVFYDAVAASKDADVVTTDTWVSMGDEDAKERLKAFADLQVNDAVMSSAKDDAIFLHCLPAHRGEEVTESVIDGKQSVIFDEAENRLHIQKAIMCYVMNII